MNWVPWQPTPDAVAGTTELIEAVLSAGMDQRAAVLAGLALIMRRGGTNERDFRMNVRRMASLWSWVSDAVEAAEAQLKAAGLWPYAEAEGPVQEP